MDDFGYGGGDFGGDFGGGDFGGGGGDFGGGNDSGGFGGGGFDSNMGGAQAYGGDASGGFMESGSQSSQTPKNYVSIYPPNDVMTRHKGPTTQYHQLTTRRCTTCSVLQIVHNCRIIR